MKQRTYLIIFVKQTTYLITLPDRSPRQRNSGIEGTGRKYQGALVVETQPTQARELTCVGRQRA